jgi:DNA-binding XRE family transcriptional regulator
MRSRGTVEVPRNGTACSTIRVIFIAARRELVKKIIALRIKEHLTQEELADKVGTNQSAISRLESGKYNPSVDFINRIARALNKKVEINFV